MILTRELLDKGKSSMGGWSKKQINILGVEFFYKGWAKDVVGKNYEESILNEFVSLKDKHLTGFKY